MMLALAQRIVDGAGDAVIFADGEGTIRLWNAAAERVFGYTAAEAVGRSLDLIVPEKHRPRHWEGYARVMRTGVTKYGGELLAVPAIRRDGSRISIEFTVTLVRDDDGAVQGIAAIVRDVSARREADTRLRRRVQELEQLATGGGGDPGQA
ncbi:MAG: PAS domain S-box protein [Candidatus Dormibacteraeota bacterium]|nr:PAS domain S-box protein [Candidatus Dormibacteraeota bacterium]MBO0703674.1 PAS domain S-box protein [Candidatus Dormibacteraeota bacterium]MBO0759641.1 PAS domain S-box protein [Candidatus Dormibacteraeota bacterium]